MSNLPKTPKKCKKQSWIGGCGRPSKGARAREYHLRGDATFLRYESLPAVRLDTLRASRSFAEAVHTSPRRVAAVYAGNHHLAVRLGFGVCHQPSGSGRSRRGDRIEVQRRRLRRVRTQHPGDDRPHEWVSARRGGTKLLPQRCCRRRRSVRNGINQSQQDFATGLAGRAAQR